MKKILLVSLCFFLSLTGPAYGQGDYRALAKDRNLIVLQIEGLQDLILGRSYRGEEISPNLNELRDQEEVLYFDNYLGLNGGGYSSDGEFVSNNSLYPSLNKASYEEYRGLRPRNLPRTLGDQGYRTYLFSPSEASYWMRDQAYEDQGFQVYRNRESYGQARDLNDRELYGKVLEELRGLGQEKFYFYISNGSSKKPYRSQGKSEDPVENYLETMAYIDRALGEFIGGLKDLGIYDETLLVIQGSGYGLDHRSEVLREGLATRLDYDYGPLDSHKTPLLLKLPGGSQGGRISKLGSQLDFYPTMARLMDLPEEAYAGVDILSHEGYRALALTRGLNLGSYYDGRYIFLREEDFDQSKAYDLRTGQSLSPSLFREASDRIVDQYRASLRLNREASRSIIGLSSQEELLEAYELGHRNFLVARADLGRQAFDLGRENSVYTYDQEVYRTLLQDYMKVYLISNEGGLAYYRPDLEDSRPRQDLILDKYRHPVTTRLDQDLRPEDFRLVVYSFRDLVEEDVKNRSFILHAGGEIHNMTYTNSLEALEQSYRRGARLVELDFEWTTDKRLVCLHSWDGFLGKFFGAEIRRHSYREFEDFTMVHHMTQLTPSLLDEVLGKYEDLRIVTDIKDRNLEALAYLREAYPHIQEKLLPQAYNLEDYYGLRDLGYEDIILTLYLRGESDQEIYDRIGGLDFYGVTMPKSRARSGLGQALRKRGIYVYTHTVNDLEELGALEDRGLDGIYTDRLLPENPEN